MSFYMGGHRFKGRAPPATSQPPQLQQLPTAATNDAEFHPLRSNSVSQESSPALSARQPAPANPTSYAARAQTKPPISVDTSPPQISRSAHLSPGSSGEPYASSEGLTPVAGPQRSRKGSVPERSPLQKLEGTFGDMSKEEKRARVEEAERNLKVRRSGGSAISGSIPRKPVGSANGNVQRSRTHTNGVRISQDEPRRTFSNRKYRKTSLGLDPFPSRDRTYGYDASRTSGAAAAAIGAYQTARQLPQESVSPLKEGYDTPPTTDHNQQYNGQTRTGADGRSTGNRDPTQLPQAHQQLQAHRAGAKTGSSKVAALLGEDPVPRNQVRRDEGGPTYTVPPQTAAGQEARHAVGHGDEHDGPHEEYGGRGGRLKFSQIIHPFSDGTGRRYKESEYLEEWRHASIATLTAAELDLDSAGDQQAWWESESAKKGSRRGRTSGNAHYAAGPYEDKSGRTAFNPPLTLKCGPLLRYTGMRNGDNSTPDTIRTFWRGTVMIVTEDAMSSLENPPTLRIFKQPMELYQPPSKTPTSSTAAQNYVRSEDPVAGQLKCGATGASLFVKHVNQLEPETDLSRIDGEHGLFTTVSDASGKASRLSREDGEKTGQYKEVRGHRLNVERGVTFWRFNIEVELGSAETRIAYRINNGPAVGFWVPARGQSMNIMFHSCNGFSLSVDPNKFSGPDPLWRDVLNSHQQKPFHVMIGGGDQIYNDAVTLHTEHFKEWLEIHNPEHKHTAPFSEALQDELETYYLNRYAMWFSQGLFGFANSQIPMVNIWDDHDIIDGYGSYPHHFMSCPVFTGLGAVAFKYYMLFQHQSLPTEDTEAEPSWIKGSSRGPYINQYSHSVYMSLGGQVAFAGLDCRTERLRDEVLSDESYKIIIERLQREIQRGAVKHLIVLLGIPIAYPRMTFAENILTSRAVDPIKALARTGMFGNVLNKFDGGPEILDDLDDHWTAKHHKVERSWLIEDLQNFAAEKSVRVTILGGDVHLAAVGQFYSKKKASVPKDHDHRYIPNIISSAIVNTPPPEAMADFLNKRNKVHHLDNMTDEDMIPLFTYDVDGRNRNNHHLLPRRNYCVIHPYAGEGSPAPSVFEIDEPPPKRRRSFSLSRRNSWNDQDNTKKPSLLRRLSNRVAPPSSYRNPADMQDSQQGPYGPSASDPQIDGNYSSQVSRASSRPGSSPTLAGQTAPGLERSNSFLRRPNIGANAKAWAKDPSGREGHIDLEHGLEVTIRCEINQKDPSGKTMPYRLLIPALDYQGEDRYQRPVAKRGVSNFLGSIRRKRSNPEEIQAVSYEDNAPATQAMAGDQRYTTMVENGNQPALHTVPTQPTNRQTAARALDGGLAHDGEPAPAPSQDLRERATLDSLPRSGVVETERPAEIPRQPYYEQRRGSLDKNRQQASVAPSKSLTGRSSSNRHAHEQRMPETAEDRAYWGAQQVRGEIQDPASLPARSGTQKGLRRFYATPLENQNSPPVPKTGLEPPLGRVNNRLDLMPTQLPTRSTSDARGAQAMKDGSRRVVSDPVHNANQQQQPQRATVPGQTVQRPAEKDPYAHLMPEAVEAEFESDDEISDLEADPHQHTNGHDALSDVSSLEKLDSPQSHNKQPHRESFVSAQTNTSLAQRRAQDDSPLYSDEDDLDNMTQDRFTPTPPARSPERPRSGQPRSQPQSRPLSKIERLTGASTSGQRASYASGHGYDGAYDEEDALPMARPVNQAPSGKAAKMLGASPEDELNGFNDPGVGRTPSQNNGTLGGLMRRISGRGDKARR